MIVTMGIINQLLDGLAKQNDEDKYFTMVHVEPVIKSRH